MHVYAYTYFAMLRDKNVAVSRNFQQKLKVYKAQTNVPELVEIGILLFMPRP